MLVSRPMICPAGGIELTAGDERCIEQLAQCGGDLGRAIENGFPRLDAFIRHLARMPLLRRGREQLLVAQPGANVLDAARTRGMLELAIPRLGDALWVLCVTQRTAARFVQTACQHGELDDELDRAPLWCSARGARFLVLSPYVRDTRVLRGRVSELMLLTRSGEHPLRRYQSSDDAPTLPHPEPEHVTWPRTMTPVP